MSPDNLGLQIATFISGAMFTACLVAGLFFLKFWKRSRELLFLLFCIAFWIFATERVVLILLQATENKAFIYLLRLSGYLCIIAAIVLKNRPRRMKS